MAAYWWRMREKILLFPLMRSANESARFYALTYLTRLLLFKQKEERQRERKRMCVCEERKSAQNNTLSHLSSSHAYTHILYTVNHVLLLKQYTIRIQYLIFLSIFFLFCAPIRREKERESPRAREREKKKKRAKCTTSASATLSIDAIVLY